MRLFILLLISTISNSDWLEYLNKARVNYLEGNYQTAEFYYNSIEDIEGEYSILMEKAQNAYRLKDYKKAIQLYEKAIQNTLNQKTLSDLHFNLGICYAETDNYPKALSNYKQSIRYVATKEAKHNYLLLKNKQNKTKNSKDNSLKDDTDTDENKLLKEPLHHPSQISNQNKVSQPNKLQASKVEKQLDELMKQDALAKKSTLSPNTNNKNEKKQNDW